MLRAFVFLFVAFAMAAASAQDRPALKGASSVRIANYGAPSKLFESKTDVNAVVEELARLRAKPWAKREAKLTCYATIIVMSGKQALTTFRVRADTMVERVPEKGGQATYYSLAVGDGDIPQITKLLEDLPPARCK